MTTNSKTSTHSPRSLFGAQPANKEEANPHMSRIFIADDSSYQQIILSGILEKLRPEIQIAVNGQEAFEKIETTQPDYPLLDRLMPIMLLMADIQEWLKIQCLELGGTMFWNKPIKQAQLEEALQHFLPTPQSMEVPCI